MMDLSLEAEAFGSTVHFSDDEVPTVTGSIVHSEEEADALKVPEIGAGRTQIYIDAIGKAVELVSGPSGVCRRDRTLLPGRPSDGCDRGYDLLLR